MSNNLNGPRIADNQASGHHRTANDAVGRLDAGMTESYDVGIPDTNAYTLADDKFRSAFRFVIGNGATSASADFTISLPASIKRGVTFWRNTLAYDATVSVPGQSAPDIVIAAGDTALIESDGVDARLAGSAGGGGGGTGAQGDKGGLRYNFSTTTTASDPGSGNFRFNNATIASVTAIYLDNATADAADLTSYIDTWDDSTSTVKGYLLVKSNANADATYAVFTVSSVTNSTGYRTLAVAFVAGTLPSNAEECVLEFIRTGDKGDTGATGPTTFVAASSAGPAYMDFAEDTDNGSNKVRIKSPDALSADATVNLPGASGDILSTAEAKNLTKGYTATCYDAGTKSSGTFTPDPANGNLQKAVNGGAHTLAPASVGSGDSVTLVVQYTNNGSAGAITTSGFTKVSGSFTTTNGDDFMCYITVINGFSHLNIVALQ